MHFNKKTMKKEKCKCIYFVSYITARPLQEGDLTAQKVADSRYAESLLADCPECSISLNQLSIYHIFGKCISETFVTIFFSSK